MCPLDGNTLWVSNNNLLSFLELWKSSRFTKSPALLDELSVASNIIVPSSFSNLMLPKNSGLIASSKTISSPRFNNNFAWFELVEKSSIIILSELSVSIESSSLPP